MLWRAVDTGENSGAVNMAIDEAIMAAVKAGKAPPTLRFYGWNPATLTLGYFQKAAAEIDLARCQEKGIAVVRRMTGGRAVLHDQEVTYSMIVSETEPNIPRTITASYHYFSQGLLRGLKKLGIDAQLTMPRAAYSQRRKEHSSAACFDAPAQYEITVAGAKLVGSAQVRKHGVILQHGSILLDFSPEDLGALLRVDSEEMRQRLTKLLGNSVTALRKLQRRQTTYEEVCEALCGGFSQALDFQLVPGVLTAEEIAASKRLVQEKYSQAAWNLRR
ncbi:MAG: biotin/lipoate A/B protein ligase family protein [Sporomusaceae bacterium]|nr:biotin/lipoate A/B protein ligase family protein [Sporomusaceae bacterium]